MLSKYILGYFGELLVMNFLRLTMHRVIAHRYRCSYGEVDIIARKADTLIFVEVKTSLRGTEVPVSKFQQNSIVQTAQHFLATHPDFQDCDIRFDFCFLSGSAESLYIENAWDESLF